ncbi:50S ribosomal protein L24 [Sulfolobus sp. S-194]|uniref:50S ribosomal protein L24 n=1 Tax=Sulfolobus sp. S-194 TaxID=2512240 RepID=UPI001436F09C|nr:50S ribosomal protein L24 [Sulfolobus sp. S-194]QIW23281.1 50S ribosomal protein L24 [Sulfolobus sp. S-194]
MVSHKPSKQRLLLYNLPKHQRHKLLTAKLSKELQQQYGIKRLAIRKGDTVKVMRGDKDVLNFEGKVVEVKRKTGRIAIEGLTRKKADGTPVYRWVHASKVIITKLDLSDAKRKEIIERKRKAREEYLKKKEQTTEAK